MCSLEESLERILAAVAPLPAELIPLSDASGSFAAQPIPSPVNLPPNSTLPAGAAVQVLRWN